MASQSRGESLTTLTGDRLRSRPSALRRLGRVARQKPLGAVSAVILFGLVFMAIFAPFIAPYDPILQFKGQVLLPPSGQYLFGTDHLGRDILSRIIFGARISLWVGLVAVGLGTLGGSLIGLISGFFGGKLDLIVQRLMDGIIAFPALVLALAIVAMLGQSITNVMLALAVVATPGAARIVRSAVLSVKENQYIEAARTIGAKDFRILFFHVLPNVTAPIIVIATVGLGGMILAESSLSFLGMGTPPPTPSWGEMLSGPARYYMDKAWWMAIAPGIALSLSVFAFNLLGDALRDIWDPRLRGSR